MANHEIQIEVVKAVLACVGIVFVLGGFIGTIYFLSAGVILGNPWSFPGALVCTGLYFMGGAVRTFLNQVENNETK